MAASVAAFYQVRWRVQGDEEWSPPVDSPVVAEINVAGLDRAKVYEFQARAVSSCGARSVWVGSDYTVPDAPALDAPVDLAASSVADGVALSWKMPSEQAASVDYVVEKAAASSGPWTEVTRVRSLQWTDPVIDATINWYRVKAVNFAGESSAYSNAVNEHGTVALSSAGGLVNPRFDRDLAGWVSITNSNGIHAISSGTGKALRRDGNEGGANNTTWVNRAMIPVIPGQRIKMSFKVRTAGAVPDGDVLVYWESYDNNDNYIGAGAVTKSTPGGAFDYVEISHTYTPPAGRGAIRVGFSIRNHMAGGFLVEDYSVTFLPANTDETPFYVGSGHRLGDTRNQAMVTIGNFGAAWNGLSITYTSTTASATLTASAAMLQSGDNAIAYNAASVSVSGSPGSTHKYYLYYVDPDFSGGSKTLNATTAYINSINSDGKVLVGDVTITYPTSGAGGGGGVRPPCVSTQAWVIRRTATGWEFARAGSIVVGDYLRVINPQTGAERWGLVTMSYSAPAECVRVATASGTALTCSITAPLGVLGGQSLAPDAVGQALAERRNGTFGHSPCTESNPVGERMVQHITCENDFHLAGDDPMYLLAHHNMKP